METLLAFSNSDFETDKLTSGPRLEKECTRLENLLTGLNITSDGRNDATLCWRKVF